MGGQSGQLPTQFFADQLNLSRGTDCFPHISTCPPSFRELPTSLKPAYYKSKNSKTFCQLKYILQLCTVILNQEFVSEISWVIHIFCTLFRNLNYLIDLYWVAKAMKI